LLETQFIRGGNVEKKTIPYLWLLVGLLLAACGGGPETPTATPTAQVEVAEPTSEPTQAPTAQPTETPTTEPTQVPTEEPTEEPVEPTQAPASEAASESSEGTTEAVESMVPYQDAGLGVTFFYPAHWYAEPQQNAVFLFSGQELSDAPTFDEGAALFVFRDDEIGVLGPEAALEVFMSRFNFLENEEVVSGVETLTINQQDAVQTTHQGQFGETAVLVTYTVITREGSSAMTMSITAEETGEAYRAIIGDIVDSVILLGAAGSE
jgi:hypothetical protein